jgi:hypothetical protein
MCHNRFLIFITPFTLVTFHHTIYLIHDSRDVFLDAPIYSAYTIYFGSSFFMCMILLQAF